MSHRSDSGNPSREVWHFPYAGAATICLGIYLHVTHLFLEPAELLSKIYTPNFDLALFIPMVFTAICMLAFWRRVEHESRWRSVVYWMVVIFFWSSVPLHLRAQIQRSNDFVFAFPRWYSVVLLPWLALQLYFFLTIKVKRARGEEVADAA